MAANHTTDTMSTADIVTSTPPGGAYPPAQPQPVVPSSSPQPSNPVTEGPAGAGSPATNVASREAIEERGVGIEGEKVVWNGRYSMKNFFGRIAAMSLLTIASAALAAYAWPWSRSPMTYLAGVSAIVVLAGWLMLLRRMALAHFGHRYQLTNRRLFVSTGVFNRRRDQIELLRLQDVYTKQNMAQRWLSVGTVVLVSSEEQLPTAYFTGVENPKEVMDLVWHHARAERDLRSVKVDEI